MEHSNDESRKESVTDLKDHCSIVFPIPSQDSGLTKNQQRLGTSFASPTPEKTTESLSRTVKLKKDFSELPENFRSLSEFFDRMVCSMRLLSLRKMSPTFKHISSQVEVLTGRKFLYGHLAKIMYIVPEVVHIDKSLVHDGKTCCMKPDIKVTLHLDALEDHHEQSTFIHVSNVFRAKLIDLFAKHPEGTDIPEAILPDPFNGSTLTVQPDSLLVTTMSSPPLEEIELLESSSHLAPSFSSHFSLKTVVPEEKKSKLLTTSISSFIDDNAETTLKTESEILASLKSSTVKDSVQQLSAGSSKVCEASTPVKLSSESASDNLCVETPAQSAPRRSASATEDKIKKVIIQSGFASSTFTVKRSLMDDLEWSETAKSFFPEKEEIKGRTFPCGNVTASEEAYPSRELEESNLLSGKDVECLPLPQQRYIDLPKLVRLIHNIFKSVGRCSMTKEELFHKIIMVDCDIDESSDIERQIALLEKLVPDWICKKDEPSGGLLYSVKSVSDLDSVCGRLSSS
ncbi:unnamed protein product [Cuscuta europaea]|uniref:CDT1 Geminin-binding domain-containing protein n=1 Tax=Cuscuta europaea TaxID=41803 RepID=A0A9P0ZU37_CUSEU|nr:unnamed protein product [Cuscuta europaea]